MKVTVSLSKLEAEAILRSGGFTNGYGCRKSQALQVAEMKLFGAVQKAYNDEIRQVRAEAWHEGARAQADAYGMDVDAGPCPHLESEKTP